jgi:SAM-dependent methyltransferase
LIDIPSLQPNSSNATALPADAGTAPGGDYELMPYPSLAYDFTQPARLAALAMLAGLPAPAAERARVLEIGGASGGNIIALAARFPNARFLGVDLSTRHIEEGTRRIAALGLTNIELRQADITTLALDGAQFDYIICHGVFSWVPLAARQAILRLCGETLAPDGMAVISYNVLPGWHLRSVVRDICLHHAGRDGSPQERVARARQALLRLAQATNEHEPYGQLLRNEARRLAQRPAAYILGEFLAESNAPLHFREFSAWAGQYGLGYLCEADIMASTPRMANPDVADQIRMLAGSDPIAFEQNVDFVTGRTFRRSVLVRAPRAGAARDVDPLRYQGLHFAAELRADAEKSAAQLAVYKDARGRAIQAEDAAVRHALMQLAARYPATQALGELVPPGSEAEARVCKALFLLTATGQVNVYSLPLAVGRADGVRPCAWPLARAEVASGQRWVTSLHHTSVPLNPVIALLLPYFDGTHEHAALADLLADALRRKEVAVPELATDAMPWAEARVREVAALYVAGTLRYLAHNALLQA